MRSSQESIEVTWYTSCGTSGFARRMISSTDRHRCCCVVMEVLPLAKRGPRGAVNRSATLQVLCRAAQHVSWPAVAGGGAFRVPGRSVVRRLLRRPEAAVAAVPAGPPGKVRSPHRLLDILACPQCG